MIIHVGSTRPAKVEGTREALMAIAALDDRFRDAELRPRDLTGAAPRMPVSEAEIVAGARLRAATLVELDERCGASGAGARCTYYVGLEGGIDTLGEAGRTVVKTWACVTDGRQWSVGAGPAVLLPPAVARAVLAGEELGELIDARVGRPVRGTTGAWGVLTRGLLGRREAFRLAVIAAFAPFYNAPLYADE